jgi:hypothetical protein
MFVKVSLEQQVANLMILLFLEATLMIIHRSFSIPFAKRFYMMLLGIYQMLIAILASTLIPQFHIVSST